MPTRSTLVCLLLLAVAPPFVSRALDTPLGAFAMFSRLERYHLELRILTPSGEQPLRLGRLAPHLSRDAQRVILPAAGYAFGGDQVELLAGGLADIARLACELRPDALAARVTLYRGSLRDKTMAATERQQICRGAR